MMLVSKFQLVPCILLALAGCGDDESPVTGGANPDPDTGCALGAPGCEVLPDGGTMMTAIGTGGTGTMVKPGEPAAGTDGGGGMGGTGGSPALAPGSSFANVPTDWEVPRDGLAGNRGFSYTSSTFRRRTFDINGDGLPDIVQTMQPAGGDTVFGFGTANEYWRVFINEGGGFEPEGVEWPVPPSSLTDQPEGFAKTSDTGYSVLDINGDGRPDIVQTRDPGQGARVFGIIDAGDLHWRIFFNNGSGFDKVGVSWEVPSNVFTGTTSWQYQTFDIDGDGLPDLVYTNNNSRDEVFSFGTPDEHWRVHINTGSGFTKDHLEWAVPSSSLTDDPGGFGVVTNPGRYEVLDLDSDGLPDLVQTREPVDGGTFTAADDSKYWRVFTNTGSGFASTGIEWEVPSGSYGRSTWRVYRTFDLTGDGLPDLVRTSNDSGGDEVYGFGTANEYWLLFTNTGSGFETEGVEWAVPASSITGNADGFSPTTYSGTYDTIDIDGNGRPDLVLTANAATGNPFHEADGPYYWHVFFNQ